MSAINLTFREDARTIALIGLAHGTSHFFHMLLPPLFPLFIRDFGLRYAELGLLVSVFFVVSGIGQALSGFLVDRVGARPILFAALSCFALAAAVTATADSYARLMVAAALAGLGNAPFHPVDFTILNKRVTPARLGHAFSVHGISGSLGWAAAPVFLAGLTALFGSWRPAAAAAALCAITVLLLVYWNRDAIDDDPQRAHRGSHTEQDHAREHALAFLRLPSVWLCFSFFFWSTCAMSAIQSFVSPALQRLYGLPLQVTGFVVTGYMLCSAVGMAVGGFMAANAERLERIIGMCLMSAAALLYAAGLGALPGLLAALIAAAAGFGVGLAGPSRDMLIKRAAPPGATGRVYGTVYSGLDLGFAVSAPIFGAMLDRGAPSSVFFGAAVALTLAVGSALLVGLGMQLPPSPASRG